ncbi:Alpha/Beta hydrolase protein [Mycena rebaudengoi]|nr:Alpha/Beta hydrolase protein [Mycena rebaudengoi]
MDCLTVCYKRVADISIYLDVYPPKARPQTQGPFPRLPTVLYFHGGGLTVGNRKSWFPTWLKERVTTAGYVFISADYRLMPSANLHDITDDIKDLFSFLSLESSTFEVDAGGDLAHFGVDTASIAVAGSSAGGTCAYLAAIHASPKPKAVLGLYSMCGNLFTPQYLEHKTKPFFLGREMLDPLNFSEFIYPNSKSLPATAESELAYHPPTSPTPGFPANPRMPLARLYLQLGVALDYMCGQHEPSISAKLRPVLESCADEDLLTLQAKMKALIPSEHHAVFPQFNVTSGFPPSFLCHGSVDTAVPPEDSRHMHMLLEKAGITTRLLVLEGKDHSFDYAPDAETLYGTHFDEMVDFLKTWLGDATV